MPCPKCLANQSWCAPPQGATLPEWEPQRLIARAVLPHDVQREAVDEAARRVALRELLADRDGGDQALVRLRRRIDPALHHAEGVVHQVAAHLVRTVGEPLRMRRALRQQEEARRADAVGGKDHDVRRLDMTHTCVSLDVDHAGGTARGIGLDALDPAVGAEFDACGQRPRPVGHCHVVERAARATALARTAIVAGEAAVVSLREDRTRHGPPVPAELIEAARNDLAHGPARARPRLEGAARRHGGIAQPAGDAAGLVRRIEVRGEVLVGNRPVGREAVLRALAEVGRAVARPGGGVDAGGAADTVPHQRRLVRAVHRVVVRAGAHVDGDRPVSGAPPLPVPTMMGALGRREPRALLQADHPDALPGQYGRRDDAAGAGADDDDVGVVVRGVRGHDGRLSPGRRC